MIHRASLYIVGCMLLLLVCLNAGCTSKIGLSEFRLVNIEGEDFDVNSLSEEFIFVNYWATWCKPCIAEMPSIESLKADMEGQSIAFLIISDESLKKIQGYLTDKEYSMTFLKKVLIENEKKMASFPQTYLINQKGEILFEKTGSAEWNSDQMKEKIRGVMLENSEKGS